MVNGVGRCLVAAGVLVAACTVSRQGTLSGQPGGTVIPVQVLVDDDGAYIEGRDPVTRERIAGRLEKVTGGGRRDVATAPSAAPLPDGIAGTATAAGRESTLDVSGILSGDLGTTLRCMVVIERRLYLKGSGICKPEGDGGGTTFRLVF